MYKTSFKIRPFCNEIETKTYLQYRPRYDGNEIVSSFLPVPKKVCFEF